MSHAPNSLRPESVRPLHSRRLFGWLRLWFLLRDPVGRRDYALSGIGLMAFKYGVEALVIWYITGLFYSPLDFFNPFISARSKFLDGVPDWFGLGWVLWSLPFLWIAVGMSVRRALDAGISPWHGLWVLVPFANLVAMPLLTLPPTAPSTIWDERVQRLRPPHPTDVAANVKASVGGIAVGALYATVVIQIGTYWVHDYGAAIFFGTPFVTGVATGYLLNLRTSRSMGVTLLVAFLSVLLCGGALLVFALEGLGCLILAAPLVVPLGLAGAPVGKFLADRRRQLHAGLLGALVIVPMWTVVESRLPVDNEFVVVSSIDVAAPPESVWQKVLAFPDIDEQPEWFFRWGISCPQGARITGQGVGATRECVFTTGKFIEPITAWDAPRRLAFDVREQPAPMFELSPYRDLHPPHLDNAFRSTRGEFQLIPLAGGGTRLVGRTWYTLAIRPLPYWTIWSDQIVHRIHLRVLAHIKRNAEATGEG